jgi:uncharacterized protein involved in exopolysaccharide biosynthesis
MIELILQFWPIILALLAGGGGVIYGSARKGRQKEAEVEAAKSAQTMAEGRAERAEKVAESALSKIKQKETVNAQVSATPVNDLRDELRDNWSRD